MALEEFYHATPIQIRFNDVDGFEHVNNTIIQEYFDIGRVHYLREAFGGELWKNDKVVLIVSIKTDFFKQTLPDDQVRVLTRVYHLGREESAHAPVAGEGGGCGTHGDL
jgi:acyl-CoA thioester hydrolase